MMRVDVKPKLFRWARQRAGFSLESLRKRFPCLESWENGETKPSFKQLENFARAVFVPIGYLFLAEPPEERVPISDLRTKASEPLGTPSPDLLDVLYLCQRRQSWYRDYAKSVGEEPRWFIGSVKINAPVEETAEAMRQALGFALADDLAPLVFINGADTKAAQMFTLAHELAHLWLGESALSDQRPDSASSHRVERWCNQAAAELLVPIKDLKDALPRTRPLDAVKDLARQFKVSTLVILRRLLDVGRISRVTFQEIYRQELVRLRSLTKSSGGNFYLTQEARASRRFVRALIVSTLEGQTLYRDAFQMLGIKKEQTFREFGLRMGVAV